MKNALVKTNGATQNQVKYIGELCQALGLQIPAFEQYTFQMAKATIDGLTKKLNETGERYATEYQLKTLKEYRKNPLLNKLFLQQFGIVPETWIIAKDKLQAEVSALEKMLGKGYAQKTVCVVGETEETADFLFNNNYITEAVYDDLLWYKITIEKACEKSNLQIIDGKIKEQRAISDVWLNSKINRLKERIANANNKIAEKSADVTRFIPYDEATRFIDEHSREYKAWRSERLSDKQLAYIKSLHYQLTGSAENMEGYELLTTKQASIIIAQMQSELKTFGSAEVEVARLQSGYSEKDGRSNKQGVAWDVEQDQEWNTMLHCFTNFIGYKPEVEANDLEQVKALVEMSDMLNNNDMTLHERLAEYGWTKEQAQFIGLRAVPKAWSEAEAKRNETIQALKDALENGLLNAEDIKALL